MADQNDEIVSRLRGISSDEKSEMGKMKCRIDDQARLIMMLKKRNDEYILANMNLDKHSIELENQIEELREELNEQQNFKDKIEELTLTIEQLKTLNYQWELKEQQTKQRFLFQNEQSNKYQQDILTFEQKIKILEDLLKESKENCIEMENNSKKKLNEKQLIIDKQNNQIQQIQLQIQNLKKQIEDKEKNIEEIKQNHLNDFDQLQKTKQLLEEQIKKLQKRLQENSNNEDKLRQQLNKSQQLLNDANQRFINEEERVNSDIRVKQIEAKFLESQQKMETIQQEFFAYKNYTASLLSKEKQLNERLQLLLSGRTT
ncbi:unnamed protein product [Adineta steineri]|uniref:Uncharacterized protein n=1 Tax=Adineta steineri TaxID=433720 RepID=A0A818YWS5_9BILA|nr:unnamed protein product [Adineta steineri]CAF1133254.1 unnamed protein product [Adineta steineri]CAF3727212.1 unnamed protein product [Adineta steineri]CAF3761256.1 unnamed protein product [Adineta steineri]